MHHVKPDRPRAFDDDFPIVYDPLRDVSCFRRSPGNRRVALMSEISALEPLRQVGLTRWRLQHDLPLHPHEDAVGPPTRFFPPPPAPPHPPPLPPPPALA